MSFRVFRLLYSLFTFLWLVVVTGSKSPRWIRSLTKESAWSRDLARAPCRVNRSMKTFQAWTVTVQLFEAFTLSSVPRSYETYLSRLLRHVGPSPVSQIRAINQWRNHSPLYLSFDCKGIYGSFIQAAPVFAVWTRKKVNKFFQGLCFLVFQNRGKLRFYCVLYLLLVDIYVNVQVFHWL